MNWQTILILVGVAVIIVLVVWYFVGHKPQLKALESKLAAIELSVSSKIHSAASPLVVAATISSDQSAQAAAYIVSQQQYIEQLKAQIATMTNEIAAQAIQIEQLPALQSQLKSALDEASKSAVALNKTSPTLANLLAQPIQ